MIKEEKQLWLKDIWFRVTGTEFMVQNLGFRAKVSSLGCMV